MEMQRHVEPFRPQLHHHYDIINQVLDQIKWKSSDYTRIYKNNMLHYISGCWKTNINARVEV